MSADWNQSEAPPPATQQAAEQQSWLRFEGAGETRTSWSAEDAVAPARPLPRIPGYELLSVLGRGGMGVVYLAVEQKLRRKVALKMVAGGAHADPEHLARFQAEAAVIAKLKHPGIVQIYEVGEADGQPYLALEFLEGGSLRAHCAGKPQDPRLAAALVRLLAEAVSYAHGQGVVHRDLKPANVLLGLDPKALAGARGKAVPSDAFRRMPEACPKITDFGLAKLEEGGSGAATKSGDVLGTPNYMAPEQAEGKPGKVGPAVDIYALGAILYELLTGRPPFDGPTPMDVLLQLVNEEPLAPRRLQPKLPRDVETICLKCLQRDPARRYASADALADDLRRLLAGEPIAARPTPFWERGWKWAKRRPAFAAVGAAACLASLALLVGGWWTSAVLREALTKTRAAEVSAEFSAQQAKKAAQQADAQRQLAFTALRQLVFDVQRKLKAVPGTREVQSSLLSTAIAGLKELAAGAASAEPDGARVQAHMSLGSLFLQIGQTALAVEQFTAAKEVNDRLDPSSNANLERATEIELFFAERSLDLDKPDDAYARLAAFLPRVRAFQAAHPNDWRAKDRLVRCLEKIGHIEHWRHRFRESLPWLEQAHALAKELAAERPGDPDCQHAVSMSAHFLARTWRDLGETAKSAAFTRVEHDICRRLHQSEPNETRFIFGLLAAQDELAFVEEELGRIDEARRLIHELPTLLESALARDPENVNLRLNLVDAWCNLGEFEGRMFRHQAMLDAFRKAQALLEDLKAKGKLVGRRIFEVERPDHIRRKMAFALQLLSMERNLDAPRLPELAHGLGDCLSVRLRQALSQGDLPTAQLCFERLRREPADSADAKRLIAKASAFSLALSMPAGLPGFEQNEQGRKLKEELTREALAHIKLSLNAGLPDADKFLKVPEFKPLVGDPEFQKLRDEAQAKAGN